MTSREMGDRLADWLFGDVRTAARSTPRFDAAFQRRKAELFEDLARTAERCEQSFVAVDVANRARARAGVLEAGGIP